MPQLLHGHVVCALGVLNVTVTIISSLPWMCFIIQCYCMCWHCWLRNQAALSLCIWIIPQWKKLDEAVQYCTASRTLQQLVVRCHAAPHASSLGTQFAWGISWAALGLTLMRVNVTECNCCLAVQRSCLALHRQELAVVMEHIWLDDMCYFECCNLSSATNPLGKANSDFSVVQTKNLSGQGDESPDEEEKCLWASLRPL